MIKLPYDNGEFILRLNYPPMWEAEKINQPLLSIYDNSGVLLIDGYSCSISEAWELAADCKPYDVEIEVDLIEGYGLNSGDRFQLVDGYALRENIEIQSFCGISGVASVKNPIRFDFATGTKLYGLFCTIELDLSDTEVFSKNKELTLVWDNGIGGSKLIERAIISFNTFQVPNLESRFSLIYPRAYDVLKRDNVFDQMVEEGTKQLAIDMKLRNMLIDRIPDCDLLVPCLLAKIRWLTLLSGDQSLSDEREVTQKEYIYQFELLCGLPIWQDNGDLIKTKDEIGSHEHFFSRGF